MPIYSHIYADDRYRDTPFLLTATLSIRNTDPNRPFTLKKVSYYDSKGALLKSTWTNPRPSNHWDPPGISSRNPSPKAAQVLNFWSEWEAGSAVVEPIIESVMIGTKMQQGISFISTGRVINGSPAR